MTNKQVTVNGPNPPVMAYDVKVNHLPNNTLLELANGQWGVRTQTGVVIFSRADGSISFFQVLNDGPMCRVLPGKLEITFTP